MRRELEIATRIQTSILPRDREVPNLEVAATMLPATEVGGDYYDVLPTADGCWFGIGDVAGHGLTSGIVMMMVQSVVATIVRANPNATPRQLVAAINVVLYENIRDRLRQDEHVTFTLLRYGGDGRVAFAGAHEEMLVRRASGKIEHVATPGTWLGVLPDIERETVDSEITLGVGDVLVLYTDGVIEARDASGAEFGMDRLAEAVKQAPGGSAIGVRDEALRAVEAWSAWGVERADDITIVVVRRAG
jgi:sigma-B regulation protein RsbU (phosphoserine phosphatase)